VTRAACFGMDRADRDPCGSAGAAGAAGVPRGGLILPGTAPAWRQAGVNRQIATGIRAGNWDRADNGALKPADMAARFDAGQHAEGTRAA